MLQGLGEVNAPAKQGLSGRRGVGRAAAALTRGQRIMGEQQVLCRHLRRGLTAWHGGVVNSIGQIAARPAFILLYRSVETAHPGRRPRSESVAFLVAFLPVALRTKLLGAPPGAQCGDGPRSRIGAVPRVGPPP